MLSSYKQPATVTNYNILKVEHTMLNVKSTKVIDNWCGEKHSYYLSIIGF